MKNSATARDFSAMNSVIKENEKNYSKTKMLFYLQNYQTPST